MEGEPLLFIEPLEVAARAPATRGRVDLDHIRPDLAESSQRQACTLDGTGRTPSRRRRKTGQRTARENVDDLVDPGSFVEYGASRSPRSARRRTLGRSDREHAGRRPGHRHRPVNGDSSARSARCIVLAYDYTVLAGTQGT